MSKRPLPLWVGGQLQDALEALQALTRGDDGVDIEREHRMAVKLYLETWVIPKIERALRWGRGNKNWAGGEKD